MAWRAEKTSAQESTRPPVRHLNAKRLRARLDAADRREDELVEQDIAIQQVRRDVALEWASHRTAIIALCKSQGITEAAWCKANLGKSLRTMQGYLQLAKGWPAYVKKRRERGNCGRYGIDFALELIAKPRKETETKRGASATGNAKGTRGRGGPQGQNTRTPLPAFRYLDAANHYDHDLCAGNKRVALCESYSRDFRKANVRGKCVFCNGPFGLNAELAAYLRDCGARHVTWLTTAAVNSRWFHQDVLPFASRIFLPDRRVRFVNHDNVSKYDTMLVVHGEVPKELDALATHSILCSGIRLP